MLRSFTPYSPPALYINRSPMNITPFPMLFLTRATFSRALRQRFRYSLAASAMEGADAARAFISCPAGLVLCSYLSREGCTRRRREPRPRVTGPVLYKWPPEAIGWRPSPQPRHMEAYTQMPQSLAQRASSNRRSISNETKRSAGGRPTLPNGIPWEQGVSPWRGSLLHCINRHHSPGHAFQRQIKGFLDISGMSQGLPLLSPPATRFHSRERLGVAFSLPRACHQCWHGVDGCQCV